jgi:hypothetical protein
LNDSKLSLFHQFKAAHTGEKISKSTFYTIVPEYFKKPSKLTDLCNVCEAGKRDETVLRNMEQHKSGSEANDVQRKRLQHRVDYYRVHKRLVNVQRKCYTSEVVSRTRHRDPF